jgi:anaerobic magnesium-protoporphyrin IX monomethyl ester cyclase
MRVLLVVYDNGSFIHWFPLGTAYVAAALEKAGHEVVVYSKDQHHWPPEHLTAYLDANRFDVVGVGVIAGYWQYRELLRISDAINASKQRPFYILGGHGPSPEPEYFMKKTGADAVVIGEGETAIVDLLNSPRPGIHRAELIKDVDSIPHPAWRLFPMDYYALLREPNIRNEERCFPMVTARGCPFKCNFCYRMDEGIRMRSVEGVVEEIKILKRDYGISYFAFMDELLMAGPKRTAELCEAFIPLNIRWSCMGRLNYATKEMVTLMKRAGCAFIGYGIECMDDQVLKNMNKNLTVDQITKGIEATLAAGVSPGFNIIFGNIGEDGRTLQAGVDFLLKYDDHSQLRTIRPVTPYPGSPLYYKAIEDGLLKDAEDFYENKHLNSDLPAVNFTNISDQEYLHFLYEANATLLENYHKHQLDDQKCQFQKLYFGRDKSFRGFRQT